MNDKKELTKIINKAKIGAMMEGAVFLSTILFSLKQSWCDTIPTADVDGVSIRINPDWFMGLTERARIGLLCHEAWHVALQHMLRIGSRDHKKWNKAGDYVINLILTDAGYELPPKGLLDQQFRGMSTAEVYDLLPDMPENESYDCDIKLTPDLSTVEEQELEVTVTNIIMKAMKQSEMQGEDPGNIPNEITRKIDNLINPVLPWNDILQRFLNERVKEDYTWSRPNRRFAPEFYLPSQDSEALAHITIAIDTSGSVSDAQFIEFLSEINYIHEVMKPKKITVIDFDTSIKEIHEIEEGDTVSKIKFKGYGGTDVKPVIEWAVENKPTVLLIFTDGGFRAYEPDINFDLMWIIYGNKRFKSNIGEVVFYE